MQSNIDIQAMAALLAQSLAKALNPALQAETTKPLKLTVREAVNDYLMAKARRGLSDRYLKQLHYSLRHFSEGRCQTLLSAVTVPDLQKWFEAQARRKAARTVHGYIDDVRGLFQFGIRQQWVSFNPARAIEPPVDDSKLKPATIHTPAQVAAVLEGVRSLRFERSESLDLVRLLAIRYFAGLRSSEAHALEEENILPPDRRSPFGYIEVPARVSKTRQRRLVTILPNLAAWLALGGVLRVVARDKVRRAIDATGVPWEQNVTRHSFCSHHLVLFESAGKTALEAGNSEEKLFAHYRAIVTQGQADDYFQIYPDMLTPREPTVLIDTYSDEERARWKMYKREERKTR